MPGCVRAHRTHQVFDNTPPAAVEEEPGLGLGAAAHIAQRDPSPGVGDAIPEFNEAFLSRPDHVLASCPVCLDSESGIGTALCGAAAAPFCAGWC